MGVLSEVYRSSLALLTDLYQITMAHGYWRLGRADREAVFHLSFRENPFRGGYAVAAGLDYVIEFLRQFRFSPEDVDYLGDARGQRRPRAASAGVPRLPRRAQAVGGRRRDPGGNRRLPPRAARARQGAAAGVPDSRNGSLESGQFPDLDRNQGGENLHGRRRRAGAGVWPAASPGDRRGVDGQPGGLHRRLRGHVQRPGRQALRHSGPRDPRPQLGHVVRRRTVGLRELRRGDAQQLRLPGRYLRYARRGAQRDPRRTERFAPRGTRWSASGSTRAIWPT